MEWSWIAGNLFAIALIFIGWSKKTRFKVASKQIFVGVGFLVLIAMTAIMLDAQYRWSQNVPTVSLAILGCLILLYRVIRIIRHRLRGGAILLDLGRVPIGEFFLEIIVAGALAANALIDGVKIVQTYGLTINGISFEILELSVAMAVFIQGIMKRNVREGGIFYGTGLVPWVKVDSFIWEGGKGAWQVLVIQRRGSAATLRAVTLSIRANQVVAVEQFLREHGVAPAQKAAESKPDQTRRGSDS